MFNKNIFPSRKMVEGQVGWVSEQPDLVESVPACREDGLEPDDFKDSVRPKAFYDAMKI